MKHTIKYIAPLVLAAACGTVNASTIIFNFEDAGKISGTGAAQVYTGPDSNDFGLGITTSAFTMTDEGASGAILTDGDIYASGDGGKAHVATREPNNSMSFSIMIPSTATVNLTSLSFDDGFNQTFNPGSTDPTWVLTISTGSATPTSGGLATVSGTTFAEANESLALSDLTGLTDTTVTFTWTYDSNRNNSLALAHTIDNITLTGTAVPEPSSAALLGLGGLALILRRRK